MADVAISYSRIQQNDALAVRAALKDKGLTVWIDDAGTVQRLEDVGIPPGQELRTVIYEEFRNADLVCILDTPDWHASKWCQDEYRYCRRLGKRLERVGGVPTDAQLQAIAAAVQNHAVVLRAHSRILDPVEGGREQNASLSERLSGLQDERDAQALLAADTVATGITITPAVHAHATAAIERRHRRRRLIRIIGVAVVMLLVVLAVASGVGLLLSRSNEAAAKADSARSRSLLLASRSMSSTDTGAALELARQAVHLSSSPATQEALAVATARSARWTSTRLIAEQLLSGVWAADADVVVINSKYRLQVVRVGHPLVDFPIAQGVVGGLIAVASDGGDAAVASRGTRHLLLVNLRTGRVRDTGIAGLSALSTTDGHRIWWGTMDGGLWSATLSHGVLGKPAHAATLPAAPIAISTSANSIALVTRDGLFRSGRVHGATAALQHEMLIPQVYAGGNTFPQFGATLTRCGNVLYGTFIGSAVIGSRFTVGTDGNLERVGEVGFPDDPAVCSADGPWRVSEIRGAPSTFLGSGRAPVPPVHASRYTAIADPTGKRSALATDDGLLMFAGALASLTSTTTTDVSAVISPGGHRYLLRPSGSVVDAVSGRSTGTVSSSLLPATVSDLRDASFIATAEGVRRIDADGHVSTIDVGDVSTFRWMHTASNGSNVIVVQSDRVVLLDSKGTVTDTVTLPWLEAQDEADDADLSADGHSVVVVTLFGTLTTIDLAASERIRTWNGSIPVSNTTHLIVTRQGRVALFAADGLARLLSPTLRLVATTTLDGAVERVQLGRSAILVGLRTGGAVLLNRSTIRALDQLPANTLAPQGVSLVSGSSQIVAPDPPGTHLLLLGSVAALD